MSSQRSRPRRPRKTQSTAPPEETSQPTVATVVARSVEPTETDQLRALEAGWDELISWNEISPDRV